MTTDSSFDKSQYSSHRFAEEFEVCALVTPVEKVGHYLHLLAEYRPCRHLLNLPRMSNVAQSADFATRQLMLSRAIKAQDPSSHPTVLREVLSKDGMALSSHHVRLSYESLSAEDVLSKLLPREVIVVWDYELISHVALLRLMEMHRPYLRTIGEVFHDKLGKDTVAAVIGDAAPTVIAGTNNLEVMVKEGQCTFNFNLSQYVWSMRLQSERDRVLRKLSRSDVLLELGAGVGALGLQAAKAGCTVITTEASEANYVRLVKNAISNRLSTKVHAYSLPARELLKTLVQQLDAPTQVQAVQESYYLLKAPPVTSLPTRTFTQVVTDLPDEETMDVLATMYGLYKGKKTEMPTLHCYLSSESEIPREDLLKRINSKWRFKLNDFDELKYVAIQRGVKRYYVSFKLPSDVAYADVDEEVESEGEIEEPSAPCDLSDLQQSMAADIAFMQQSMKEGLQPSLLMSYLSSFVGGSLKRSGDHQSEVPAKVRKE